LSVCWFGWFDCDETLGSAKTNAEGAFSLEGTSMELSGLEPFLIIKACRKADDESSCNVKKFMDYQNGVPVTNYYYFMDDEFCHHCEGGGECKSA
jgi:hypothetical protein